MAGNRVFSQKRSLHKNKKRFIVFLLFTLVGTSAYSQNSLVMQTLEKARTLRNDKQFEAAAKVLGAFEEKYPGNIWIERLYAQTLFWIHNYKKSDEIYSRALHYHPDDLDLKYEYSLLLFSMKKYDQAKTLLQIYTRSQKDNGGAEGLLGKIYYYQRDFKKAAIHLKKALHFNPGNKEFQKLYRQVYRITSPNLMIGGKLRSDTQPMTAYGPMAQFQWYHSGLLDLSITGNYLTFSNIPTQNSISYIQIGNAFSLGTGGTKLKLDVGQNYSGLSKSSDWNGGISLVAPISKVVKFEAGAQRLNYNYTESSVEDLLMINQYSLDLVAGKSTGWNGMAGAQTQYYPDNNYVSAFYGWFLSKPINLSGIKLSLGYAFNYMDSKEDRFELKSSYNQSHGKGNTNSGSGTQGIYVPYYTPHDQFSNSLLANISAVLGKGAHFYAHASVGIYSQTYAPYFVKNTSGIVKKFGYQTYYPLDLGGSLNFNISRQVVFKINYDYQKTYYFNSNILNLALRFYL